MHYLKRVRQRNVECNRFSLGIPYSSYRECWQGVNISPTPGNLWVSELDINKTESTEYFIPGTIHCPTHSASSVADNLISMSVPTRRARSAAWIHHFDHKATWCPLYINLPNTVIVHEVVIQPHSASLSSRFLLGGV